MFPAPAPVPDVSDETLVARAREGDDEALDTLLLRYRPVARARARCYFLVGADHDDVVQEGMIGLYRAVREFDPEREASFRTFAELCISRQILTAIRTATRHKHRPLNHYVSFHRPVLVGAGDAGGDPTLADVLPASAFTDPAEQVVCAERIRDLHDHVDVALSDLEVEVLRLHIDGVGYREIAVTLQRGAKSIDNALQRIRHKLGSHLAQQSA
ncbi:MAG TPA: RNA polymerase sporulation sigma factor SigH [Nocardioides sp.]|nr:RNA polymerase sporulation sigma factor SigH [Nocardioides sp.]